MTVDHDALAEASRLIADARDVVVFTGAGMSAESGVPTFRDAMTGTWSRFDPQQLATPESWQNDRALVWSWYAGRAADVRRVEPNAGHEAIARLGERKAADGGSVAVVTQNVDDLHERAGSPVASHLHGSLFAPRCDACEAPGSSDAALDPELQPCRLCPDGVLRPGVVWFGEPLPPGDWSAAERSFHDADLVLVVGTSGVVYPAAELPMRAAFRGVPVIEINPEPSELAGVLLTLSATACQVLPGLVG
ncbi:MAG: NAD-dependent deacylase [Gordonia sp. (in: high G+C Gram-positive bacteria)]|uniref:NAD-dependent deacylase n=1 Tax=Gordonia sp. (in: high G+C Gram-positive bacteria) TaxID=84139 RepID=UPI0039E6E3D4